MEGTTYEILDGSCVSVDIGLKLRRRPKRLQGCSPGNLNLATLSMESPQAESSAKRRRLTHRDMHVAAWTEGSSSEKKKSECEDVEIDRVKIKKEKVAEPIHVVGKDVQWLKAKKEIKDDMEQDMKSSNFYDVDDVPFKEVEVKDEIENDEEDHDKSPQQSELAVKQEVRRRQTRKVQVAAWTETSSSEKKESECVDVQDDSVRIKKEKVAEPIHVVGKDVQWLKAKKEIKDDMEQDMKSSNFDDVDDVPLKEVEVKDEIENDEEDHDKSPQQSELAVKQEVRRRQTRKVQVAAWTETSSSEKKESECVDVQDDSVRIKKEKVAEPIHVVGEDVEWLKVKKEIKNDMEQDMKSSDFDDVDDVPLKEVEVKDEMKTDEEDDDKSPYKSEVAVKQEVRRRLTRKVQVAAWTETSRSEKKGDDRAKIKMETVAEHEASFASPLADADGHEDGRTHAHFSTLKREDSNPKKCQNL